ncbi:replication-relaxation family protein [Prosthecobacter sp.]|uniref:replication-relaxation family protein n=1 Tax=Prosthecobacter sp. TaxID=1965333 RepID=UPI0024871EB1|nr:replication-relaxation family protein [Prosthecobacter sp.]MDI1311154.1 replication-relaxation family protein [Prosthecobacter sp.]
MPKSQQRLPRFTRDSEAAGSFQITARDIEILCHVAEHRFIRSEWLVKLISGSRQQLLRRLNLLYHHSYLERPRAQLDYYHEGGSKSLVYGLASRGAGRLRRDLDMPFHRMDWTTRNKSVGRLFLEHTLMVSDFMTSLELDCRQRPDVRLLYAHELPQPKGRENRREPFRWIVDLPGKRRVGVVPDKVFALEVTHPDGRIERTHYFLEADQGTMPIERRDLRQSCVLRKLKSYEGTYATGIHRTRLGAERFRVLIITPMSIRAQNIREAVANLEKGRRLFFVFSDDDWRACDGVLNLVTPHSPAGVNSR